MWSLFTGTDAFIGADRKCSFAILDLMYDMRCRSHVFAFVCELQDYCSTGFILLCHGIYDGRVFGFDGMADSYVHEEMESVFSRDGQIDVCFDLRRSILDWELISTIGLVVMTFALSNINFLISGDILNNEVRLNIFKMRTLIDFSGIAVLYAFQSRVSDYISKKEIATIHTMLKSQYDQYRS